jgi:hypothetical protein
MSVQVVIATGLTSQEADELVAATKEPPTTATNVKKVAQPGNTGLFNVEATFPKAGAGSGSAGSNP